MQHEIERWNISSLIAKTLMSAYFAYQRTEFIIPSTYLHDSPCNKWLVSGFVMSGSPLCSLGMISDPCSQDFRDDVNDFHFPVVNEAKVILVVDGDWSICITTGPFHWHGLTEIRAWIHNHAHGFMWDVLTHPCLKVKLKFWMDEWLHPLALHGCDYLSAP